MRSFTALVNPISGGGRAAKRWEPLAERIVNAGATVSVELTRSREHAIERCGVGNPVRAHPLRCR